MQENYGAFQKLVTSLATEFINLPVDQFDAGIDRMLQKIGALIGADRAYIYHFSDDLCMASMTYEWHSATISSEIKNQQNVDTSPFTRVFGGFKRGESDFIPRVADLPQERLAEKEQLIARGIQSRITIPLFLDDKLIGSMGFHAMRSNPEWAEYTVDLLKIVAEIYLSLLDRQQTEQQMRYHANLLDNVSDSIISTDMQWVITSWNRGAEKLYGFKADDVIGKPMGELVKPTYSLTSGEEIIRSFMENGKWEGEVIHHGKDGKPIHIWGSVSMIKDMNGNSTGAVSVNHDIGERKKAEEQQIELTLQHERIQLLEEIISDLSHDFKTPLATIQLSLHMLQKATEPDVRQKYLTRITNQIDHLTKLVEDILTMTRLEKGGQLEFTPVQVNMLVENLRHAYDDLISKKQNTLTFDLGEKLPSINCNQIELTRVFANLIENAINYTPKDKSILVRTYVKDNEVVFEVQDTGIGISEDDLHNIFNRFYRADKARDANKGGTGLGLAIVKRIVELHRGTINVASHIQKGSTFSVHLPINLVSESSALIK